MAKATRSRKKEKPPTVEELYFRSDSAYLCLLLNRRTRFIRVIDFRAGALPAKRLYIQSVAKRESVAKVITLVEKDEVSSWTRVGFVREGTIPGFYKRSDGHLCGCVIGDKTASIEVSDDGVRTAERTVNNAKKIAKDIPDAIKGATIKEVEDTTALAARDLAWKKGRGVGSFDTFGRDAQRIFYECTYRRAKTNYISAEFQDCFGHSLLEILKSPQTDAEMSGTVAGIRHVCDELTERGIVSAFSFAAADDVQLGASFIATGFRKTGLLAAGILSGDERKDAILWTRKLVNPGAEEN